MHIGILTSGSDEDADIRLLEAAEAKGHVGMLIDLTHCSLSLCSNGPHIFYKGKPYEERIDAVIPRIDLPHTEFGLAILRQFHALEIPSTDMASSIKVGRDKLRCLQYLARKNIPMPVTGFAYVREDFLRLIQTTGGVPVVIKVLEGTGGNGVYLAKNTEEAVTIFDSHNKTGMRTIIQEFIKESAGTDIRSFIVGDQIIANMRRVAQTDDFRANVVLGAHSFSERLTPEEEAIILKATQTIGINVAGVDFVRSNRGPLLLEINTSPAFTGDQGLESATGADIAGAMIDFAVSCALHHKVNYWYNTDKVHQQFVD